MKSIDTLLFDAHTHHESPTEGVVSIINRYVEQPLENGALYSMGIHPWHIPAEPQLTKQLALLQQRVLSSSNIVAIGETGIDRSIQTPVQQQEKVFMSQLSLAQKAQKPVIVHCVRAYPDIVRCIKETGFQQPVIFHGYRANIHITEMLMTHGFWVSLGERSLTMNSETLKCIRIDKLLVESDDTPGSLAMVYEALASRLGFPLEYVTNAVEINFRTVFEISSIKPLDIV